MESIKVLVQQTPESKDLPLPKYMSLGAAGMDLYAAVEENTAIPVGKIRLIPTGLKVSIPVGYEIQIRPRSGLALKHGIMLVNSPGTIDSDYRGEIKIIMMNLGEEDFVIRRGDRVAQMVLKKVEQLEWEIVKELPGTDRDAGGFGHTGK